MAASNLELLDRQDLRPQASKRNPRPAHRGTSLSAETASTDNLHDRLDRLSADYRHLDISFDSELGALWCHQRHVNRPCFSEALLDDVLRLQITIKDLLAGRMADQMPFRYLIWASSMPGIYNLGGDLEHFCRLVRAQDAEGLHVYAKRCVDVCYMNAISLDLPILTVALVQGDALGGGFESVLSNDLIIAEEGAKFGLPEVVFNLFPGMGAYSFLSRRLDASRARQMIMKGRLYTAEELYDVGIVDLVVPQGKGDCEMRLFIERNKRRLGMLTAMARVGRRCQPVSHEELIDVAELWVETTLGLSEDDLGRMQRLITMQNRRRQRADAMAAV